MPSSCQLKVVSSGASAREIQVATIASMPRTGSSLGPKRYSPSSVNSARMSASAFVPHAFR